MATSDKQSTNPHILRPAFVFGLELASRPGLVNPARSLVNRVLAYARLDSSANALQRRFSGTQNLNQQILSRYARFSTGLGPLNRAVRFRRRRPAGPDLAQPSFFEPDMDMGDDQSFELAREYAPQPDRSFQPSSSQSSAFSEPYLADYEPESWEAAPLSPLSSQTATFLPTVLRSLAVTEPTRRSNSPDRQTQGQNVVTQPTRRNNNSGESQIVGPNEAIYPSPGLTQSAILSNNDGSSLTPLQRSLARLEAAETAEANPLSAGDAGRPAALSLSYFQPGLLTGRPAWPAPELYSPALPTASTTVASRSLDSGQYRPSLELQPIEPNITTAPTYASANPQTTIISRQADPSSRDLSSGQLIEPQSTIYNLQSTIPLSNAGLSPLRRALQRVSVGAAEYTGNDWLRSGTDSGLPYALPVQRRRSSGMTVDPGLGGSETQTEQAFAYADSPYPPLTGQVARSQQATQAAQETSTRLYQNSVGPTSFLPLAGLPGFEGIRPVSDEEYKANIARVQGLPGIEGASPVLGSPVTEFRVGGWADNLPSLKFNPGVVSRVKSVMDGGGQGNDNAMAAGLVGWPGVNPDGLTWAAPTRYGRSRSVAPLADSVVAEDVAPSSRSTAEVSRTLAEFGGDREVIQRLANQVVRSQQAAQAAQETSTRLYQNSVGPTSFLPLAGLPGFEAVGPVSGSSVNESQGWSSNLPSLKFNPGVVSRLGSATDGGGQASESSIGDGLAVWPRVNPGGLAWAEPARSRRSRAADVTDSAEAENVAPSSRSTTEVLRSLAELGGNREVIQRLAALVEAGGIARQMGGDQAMTPTRYIAPASAFPGQGTVGALGRAVERSGLTGASSDFEATPRNYITPPLALRKAASPSPSEARASENGSGLPEAAALANFLTSLGLPAALVIPEAGYLSDPSVTSDSTAVRRTLSAPNGRSGDDDWNALPLNYAGPGLAAEARRSDPPTNPFAFQPSILTGLKLTTQTRRLEQPSPSTASLSFVQRSTTNLSRTGGGERFVSVLSDFLPDEGASQAESVLGQATHFETPFDQPIGVVGQPQPMLQRKATGNGVAPVARAFDRVLKTSVGQTLDKTVQRRLGQAFGASFDHVRVHTDNTASDYTTQMGAEAFTVGSSIFFAPGRYQPHSPDGQALIGHELTHVMQQASLPSLGGGRIPETSSEGQALEHEALSNERLLLRHLSVSQPESSMRVSGETRLNLGETTSNFQSNGGGPVQRSYTPVEPVHLQESASSSGGGEAGSVQRVMSGQHQATHLVTAPGNDDKAENQLSVEELAEQVYRLLRQRLIVERERGGPSGGRFF